MTFQIDATYLSAFSSPVFQGAVLSLENSAARQEGDDGSVACVERWARRRRRWQLTYGTDSAELVETLFEVCGNSIGFLWVPPRTRDYTATVQTLGTGNGSQAQFQLVKKVSTRDLANAIVRSTQWNILYPLNNASLPVRPSGAAVAVFLNGTPTAAFTIGALGVVTMTSPPGAGVIVTATFQYATPVQFLSETLETTLVMSDREEVRSVAIGEVFL
jgi:uncharacterized protein (TIGR02217 family)